MRALPAISLLAACLLSPGCRSSRQTTEDTRSQRAEVRVEAAAADSSALAATSVTLCRDSVVAAAVERGSMVIDRDSSGRAVKVVWRVDAGIEGTRSVRTVSLLRASTVSTAESSGAAVVAVDDSTAHVETHRESTAATVERWLRRGLLGLIALGLGYVVFSDCVLPWIKRKLRR